MSFVEKILKEAEIINNLNNQMNWTDEEWAEVQAKREAHAEEEYYRTINDVDWAERVLEERK